MKQFDITAFANDGEYIIHLGANNSLYEVTYDHGQITFQNAGKKYIIPENVGDKVKFFNPDPNTGKEKYILNNIRDLYRDTTPTDFGLGANLVDVDVETSFFTEEIVVGGTNESIPVVAPAGVIIWVNGSVVASGTEVDNGDVVKFEIISGSDYETSTNYNLSVGDITKTFNIITRVGYHGLTSDQAFRNFDDILNEGYTGIKTLWTTLNGQVEPFQVQVNFNTGNPYFGMSFDFSGSVWGDAQVGDSVANGGYNNENMVGTTVTTSSNVGSFKWDGSGSNGNLDVGFGVQTGFSVIGKTNWDGNWHNGNTTNMVYGPFNINYTNPITNANFTAAQMTALRNMVTDLAPETPFVAWHGDTDGAYGSASYTASPAVHGGHSVWIKDASGNWLEMLPRGVSPSNHGVMTLFTRNTFNMYKTTGGTYQGSATLPTGLYTNGLLLPTQFSPMINTGGGIGLGAYYNPAISPKVNNKVVFLIK